MSRRKPFLSVVSFVGGFIALAVVELLLLLIYVFAKLLSFRAHKKQQNPASSSAARFHTCGTIINFDVQGFSACSLPGIVPSAWPLSLSLCALVFARIECFPVCWASNSFAAIAHRNNNRITIIDLGQLPMQLLELGCCYFHLFQSFLQFQN